MTAHECRIEDPTYTSYLLLMVIACGATKKRGRVVLDREDAAESTVRMPPLELLSVWPRIKRASNTRKWLSESLVRTLIFSVCGWSLIEAPFEFDSATLDAASLAVGVSKLILTIAAIAAAFDVRYARGFFSFMCGASVLAISPALPLEYTRSAGLALISTVECFIKAAYVIALGIVSWKKTHS
jgi:hypothetical protein